MKKWNFLLFLNFKVNFNFLYLIFGNFIKPQKSKDRKSIGLKF
ncbi:hypothetical protein P872_17900 [Rhodonellum psychrophilum GCM71 = DSM 17998]|uniref:Uncharacterized protein n=1 Tax=Rhodonellum psychrophilum GCM71 = DSM 17998 TaxID=1123057 RepID=U5BY55_9BACT|nr:hypothetical protein P872_17900 [Rhodonellum psychrophilum GCM71 = DSM 17998]